MTPINATVATLLPIAVAPIFFVDIPALNDFLNHLARMHVLANAGAPDENPFYEVTWNLYTNMAMDLIVPPLGRVIGVDVAAKAFLVASQVLVVTGAVALEVAVKGRHQFSGLIALITLFSMPFMGGQTNFEFGTGLALWAAASWFALRHRPGLRFAVHCLLVAMLFVTHFVALGIYGVTIGICELRRLVTTRRRLQTYVATFGLMALPVLFLLGVALLWGGAVTGGATEWRGGMFKVLALCCSMNGYSITHSMATVFTLVIGLGLLWRPLRSITMLPEGKWLAIGFAMLFVIMPWRVSGSAWIDGRVVIAAFLILPAFIVFAPARRELGYISAGIAVALVLANVIQASAVWLSYRDDYAAVRASLKLIEPRSVVLIGHSNERPVTFFDLRVLPMLSAPTLAAAHAKALVPQLFSFSGVNPIDVRSEFKHLDVREMVHNIPIQIPTLIATAHGESPPQGLEFIERWPERYQYLYMLGPRVPNPLPGILEEIAAGGRFILYRVTTGSMVGGVKLQSP